VVGVDVGVGVGVSRAMKSEYPQQCKLSKTCTHSDRPELRWLTASVSALLFAMAAMPPGWQTTHHADVERLIDSIYELFREEP